MTWRIHTMYDWSDYVNQHMLKNWDLQKGGTTKKRIPNPSQDSMFSYIHYMARCIRLGATTAQPRSGRSHKITEWDRRMLKLIARKNSLSLVATFTSEFQTASGSNVSTISVSWELHEMGFHGRAAAHKHNITMRNAKRRLEWCKACRHWTLEQWKRVL